MLARCSYASFTSGCSCATSCARASPNAPPASANFSSHTSSVTVCSLVSCDADERYPICLSNALRCFTMRSTSRRVASCFTAIATNASSMNRRRSLGPSLMSAKSSGEKMVVRNTPNKSRLRTKRCLFTWALLRPVRDSSTSINNSRPSGCFTVARNIAVSAPLRMSVSVGTPRKLSSVAKYVKASARLVFPCPFEPNSAVVPRVKETSASS